MLDRKIKAVYIHGSTDLIFRMLYPWPYEVLAGNQAGRTRNGQRNADQYCQAVTHLTAEFDQLH